MSSYLDIIANAYSNYYDYLITSLTKPWFSSDLNYFYYLIVISLAVWGLELMLPWRKKQAAIRKDFWLDTFYMFFNFFIFNLLLFAALSSVTTTFIDDSFVHFGYARAPLIDLSKLNIWLKLSVFFIIADFIQWLVHNSLHRIPFLWRFHKVHHSVKEMGFAAHLRFHFMETVFYKSALYIGMFLIFGFDLKYGFIMHGITILVGHLNHANLGWDYGVFGYLFNNPKMHIWHHSKALPENHPKGMNFGITLSIWDYIFKTSYIPNDGKDIELGFDGDEKYPKGFIKQMLDPFITK